MASPMATPRSSQPRRRGRPPGTTNAVRAARAAEAARLAALGESSSSRKRRYVPGGPGGGGRYVESDGLLDVRTPGSAVAPATAAASSRRRAVSSRDISYAASPVPLPRRERSTRTRATAGEDFEEIEWGSAAAVAASVKQAEDYKPREERSWEEFHPNLDIEKRFVVFTADEVDGVSVLETPGSPSRQTPGTPLNGSMTPSRHVNPTSTGNTPNPQMQFDVTSNSQADSQSAAGAMTPTRRSRRMVRESVSFYGVRAPPMNATPRTPRILPISNQTPKERLDLKQPSFRKTNRIELFESKTFGQARYVDKAMSNVGYQESDHFLRPDDTMLRAIDGNAEDDAELSLTLTPSKSDENNNNGHGHGPPAQKLGRVEYDMDEQDDMWLEHYNAQRKQADLEPITREVFEITMTKIEKEWHALERRIPKPNPKPPQTHRPRSSSAAAVNGEVQSGNGSGDEPDSKCVICDDGDCENTNAIVFCDGCNLAVHQECYGVPFIPEGQWLCRKCQLCGRGVPTCIFCPNTDGAFKQTNSSKWAHLLCAMWIPEISLGNHTFMEPVMDVEKVPKTRWKLNCYICRQRMGACIQCSNKNCYQAFHVTCARRSRLYLKMKTSHGALAVLDGSMVLKAFCHNHCPPDYTIENNVHQATRAAKKFYKRNMRGRIWADNQAMANVLAAQHRVALAQHPSNNGQMGSAKGLGDGEQDPSGQGVPPKNLWKLPSGAPIIPQAVYEVVEASIQRFSFRKRKDFLGEVCRYWTLKREARRGAALLKRLQLQMEAFSSMELTRRDFVSMGPNGKTRLARRIEFAQNVLRDLEQLKELSEDVVRREQLRVDAVELERDFVDEFYFPVAKLLEPAIEKAILLDKELFEDDLDVIKTRVEQRYYTTVLPFAQELGDAIGKGIRMPPAEVLEETADATQRFEGGSVSSSKTIFADVRERRKLGKRILKSVQPFLEAALKVEAEITSKSTDTLSAELDSIIEASLDTTKQTVEAGEDTVMMDAQDTSEITVKSLHDENGVDDAGSDAMDTAEDDVVHDNIEVDTSGLDIVDGMTLAEAELDKSRQGTRGGAGSSSESPDGDYAAVGQHQPPQRQQKKQQQPAGPPTPPQSNGSLGRDPATDPLTEGGVLWHLKAFEPWGTSAVLEATPGVGDGGGGGGGCGGGFDAARLLSEDLTDLDEVELKGLGVVDGAFGADEEEEEEEEEQQEEEQDAVTTRTSKTTRANKARARRTSGRLR